MAGAPDPALAALLADPRMALRPPPLGMPVTRLRAAADAFLAAAPRPTIDVSDDYALPGGPAVRLYRPVGSGSALPVVVFAHGGGFVFGSLETHDALCRAIANASGVAVIAVDYRLAPEHRWPAPVEDVAAALGWVHCAGAAIGLDPARIALAGDSAGAHVVLSVALSAAGVRHMALLYPLLDPLRASASARTLAEGYMLTGAFLDWAWDRYRGDRARDDPLLAPARADLTGLPAATIVTAEFDPLRDEGEALAKRLHSAGRPVAYRRYAGMIHGFAGLPRPPAAAADAIAWVAGRLADALAD